MIYQDGSYLEKNPLWHEEDSPWKARQIVKMLERNALHPKTVCEIGCGAGEILNRLSCLYPGTEFTGSDISPQAHELNRRKVKANLSFLLADILKDEKAWFDLIMAIDVLEHVEDYFGFLRKVKDKAEHKIFHIPLDLSVQTVWRRAPLIDGRKAVGHLHYFTKETALETLKDTGYQILDWFYTGGSLALPNRSWKTSLLKIPRWILFALHRDLTVRILGGYSLMVLAK